MTVIIRKILTTGTRIIITLTVLRIEKFGMHLKDADGMANSVHPDQTAPLGAV